MRRFFSFLTALLFFVWILPLGVFIKPDKEKEACNGQRAICLCSHLLGKQMAKNKGTMIAQSAGTSTQKESGASASHHFTLAEMKTSDNQNIGRLSDENTFSYSLIIPRLIDPVPKNILSVT